MTEMTAIVTGAGQGFGLALTAALADRGSTVIACARDADRLRAATAGLPGVRALPGDVTDPEFRAELVRAAGGRLDLLVHNAGELGPVAAADPAELPAGRAARRPGDHRARAARAHPARAAAAPRSATGTVITLSSDAAVEAYPGWGGYGAAKAALDQLAAVLAAEEPTLRVYAFDPGDMRTAMHQRAFPGEDISDRPLPETVVPALLRLLDERPPSGRLRAADLLAATGAVRGGHRRSPSPPSCPRSSRRRPAGWPATRSGCWWPGSDGRCATSGSRPAPGAAPRRPGRGQHLGHRAGRGRRAPIRRAGRRAARVRSAARRRAGRGGGRAAHPGRAPGRRRDGRRADPAAARRGGHPAGRAPRSRASPPAAGCGGLGSRPGGGYRWLRVGRTPDPLLLPARPLAAGGLPHGVRRAEPTSSAAPRCPAPPDPFTPRGAGRAARPRRAGGSRWCCTPGCRRWRPARCRCRSATGCRRPPPTR